MRVLPAGRTSSSELPFALFYPRKAQQEYDQATLQFLGLRVRQQAAFPTRVFSAPCCLDARLNFPACFNPGEISKPIKFATDRFHAPFPQRNKKAG